MTNTLVCYAILPPTSSHFFSPIPCGDTFFYCNSDNTVNRNDFNTYTARPVCWNGWISDSYCSLKPLCSGMGEVVLARTSPTLLPHPLALCCHYSVSKCRSASIAVTGTLRVKVSFCNLEIMICRKSASLSSIITQTGRTPRNHEHVDKRTKKARQRRQAVSTPRNHERVDNRTKKARHKKTDGKYSKEPWCHHMSHMAYVWHHRMTCCNAVLHMYNINIVTACITYCHVTY